MGIGAGWSESEFRMYGMPFPAAADRIRMLDEACAMLTLLWTQPRATFEGGFYKLTKAIAEPKPLQRPRPPLWVGGNGPKRTLRVVAERADVWSCDVWPTNAAVMKSAYELATVLDAHCVAVGRDPRTIRRAHALVADDGEAALAIAGASVRAGFTDFLLVPVRALGPGGDLRAGVEAAAKLIPRIRALA
jgi:alkanesulfonate monooxygenase SsuD/methylene tetrahydromethanopterin reductase-like flavin-dependent oxidoreductase (luciferase family)